MEKYTATAAAEETTDAKPELVAHVAKTLEGVSDELARDLVAGVKGADVVVLANDSASMGSCQDEWRWGERVGRAPAARRVARQGPARGEVRLVQGGAYTTGEEGGVVAATARPLKREAS